MPHFMIDDQAQVNPKFRRLAERAVEGDLLGLAAIGLWTMTGSLVQAQGSDGVASRTDLIRITLNPDVADELARLLVDAGLWHAAGHEHEQCARVGPGQYAFHEWFLNGNYDTAQGNRTKRAKSKELKQPQLIAEVWARDQTVPDGSEGACRYCKEPLKRADRRSERAWQLDHVDPTRAVGARNVVLACKPCNQRKGNRTPAEAGMVLLPPPAHNWARRSSDGVSPAAGAAAGMDLASPGSPVAGATVVSPAPAAEPPPGQRPPPDHSTGSPDRSVDASGDRPPDDQLVEGVPRGYAGARGPGRVTGSGLPPGFPQGEPQGQQQGRRRRRRGRGRGGSHTPSTGLDAGAPPEGVRNPGRWGSPWAGWSGPPSPVTDTDCETHALPQPCWKCARAGDEGGPR